MTTILTGIAAQFPVTVQVNGAPVAIADTSTVQAQLVAMDGHTALCPATTSAAADPGADWSAGVVVVSFDAAAMDVVPVGDCMLVVTSSAPALAKRFLIHVESAGSATRSQLFIKDIVIEELRADSLFMASANFFAGQVLSDDYLWGKLLAAESSIAHTLRVPLVPTQFFPSDPTADDLASLPPGMPWAIDPPYDYGPAFFEGDSWGYIATRQKPVQSIQMMKFAYPDPAAMVFEIPQDWIRLDQHYGVIRLVPSTYAVAVPLSSFIMQAVAAGRTIPFMLNLKYVAGIANARAEYPELIDAIKKLAVLKSIEDGFLPQSGSISADGLSQSMSVDMDKYRDTIDYILNGPKGSNGGLMTAIHGIRSTVLG